MPANQAKPGPWTYKRDSCSECERRGEAEFYIPEIDSGCHAPFTNEADVEFIVRACNSHEALLEALKADRDAMVEYLGDEWSGSQAHDLLRKLISQSNNAISLAEKGQQP